MFATDDGDVVVAVVVERRRRQTSLTFSFHFVGIIYLRCGCSRRRCRCCFRCYNTSFVCYFRLIALLSAQQIWMAIFLLLLLFFLLNCCCRLVTTLAGRTKLTLTWFFFCFLSWRVLLNWFVFSEAPVVDVWQRCRLLWRSVAFPRKIENLHKKTSREFGEGILACFHVLERTHTHTILFVFLCGTNNAAADVDFRFRFYLIFVFFLLFSLLIWPPMRK